MTAEVRAGARSPVAKRLSTILLVLSVSFPLARASAQPTEADVFVSQAILDFDDKRYDDALANLRRALEIQPDHLEALYYTGVVQMARDRADEAVPVLERAHALAPGQLAVTFQLGLAYFVQRQYDRAQPLLEEVFRANPTQDGLGYYVGFMRYRNKDYRGALAAFRAGRASSPEIQKLTRFYSGLALGVLGLPGRAAAEVEQALRLAPGSALTGPVERLRETLAAAGGAEHRLSLEARLGVFYDDNVTVIPDPDTSEPLVPELRHRAHESTGGLAGLRADYTWLRTENWQSSIGGSFFGTCNYDLPSLNIIDVLGTVGLVRQLALGAMPAQLGLQYAFDDLLLDEDRFLRRHTVALSGTLVEGEVHLTQVFWRYQNKNFHETVPLPSEERRDADNWTAGLVHLLRFARDRHLVKLGYQWDWDDAAGRNYKYHGRRFLAGVQYTVPWQGIRLKYDLDAHLRRYVHKNSLLPSHDPDTDRRRDTELTHVVRVEWPLSESLTLAAEYQSNANDSNLAVFAYTRNVYSLSLSWSY